MLGLGVLLYTVQTTWVRSRGRTQPGSSELMQDAMSGPEAGTAANANLRVSGTKSPSLVHCPVS